MDRNNTAVSFFHLVSINQTEFYILKNKQNNCNIQGTNTSNIAARLNTDIIVVVKA